MKLPQVGDRFRFTNVSYPNTNFSLDKEYVVTKVEYPDEFLENWFYLIGEDGRERPFLGSEVGLYLIEVEAPTSDSPLWSL